MAFMGIDGGGSVLRVAIVDAALSSLAQVVRATANPRVIGYEAAAALIRDAMLEALARTTVPIEAVGIGVAGASADHSGDWLREVVHVVLPGVPVAASSDALIALAGAQGGWHGAMVLAGTGSVAIAIGPHGDVVQTGGWGYLLGDEGSGYWLGLEALRACTRWQDGAAPEAARLGQTVLNAIRVPRGKELLAWAYRQPTPTREIAQLSAVVLDAAQAGDGTADAIVLRGALALAAITRAALAQAGLESAAIQFGGGLLTSENALTGALCRELGLAARPVPRHPPVVGAALLAKLTLEG